MPVTAETRHQELFTIPHGSKLYGPLVVRDEYVEFIWNGEKCECHLDEFVNGTRADSRQLAHESAVHGPRNAGARKQTHSGQEIASGNNGGLSKPRMEIAASPPIPTSRRVMFCPEQRRLLDVFGEAVQELLLLHEQQFLAIVSGDLESHRFDLLIHMANEKKQQAKYGYLQHVETHGCSAN
jgi:hypothetical protein